MDYWLHKIYIWFVQINIQARNAENNRNVFGVHFKRIKTPYKFDGVAIILYNETDNSTKLSVDIFTKFQTVSEQDKIYK